MKKLMLVSMVLFLYSCDPNPHKNVEITLERDLGNVKDTIVINNHLRATNVRMIQRNNTFYLGYYGRYWEVITYYNEPTRIIKIKELD